MTFIDQIAPIIQKYANQYGYKVCSAIIAQACLESAYGKSGLAKYHNYFGLKCGSSWKGKSVNMKTKEEYTVGNLTTIRDNFRAYDSMEEGVKGYFEFISTKRYANLKTAKTPLQYLTLIKHDGYATSSTYVRNNMNVVVKYNLAQYDDEPSAETYEEPTGLIKLNSRGDGVKWLQNKLNEKGYNLKVDGIAGNITIGAVLDFQKKHGLVPDGVVGPDTQKKLNE